MPTKEKPSTKQSSPRAKPKTKAEPKKLAEKRGRPSAFKEQFIREALNLCLLGATDADLARSFDVDERTINRWKIDHPLFCQSLKEGREHADAVIASKLYHRAKGYEHKELITASFQGQITDTMEVIKHYPPDTTAAIFWLKNRRPKEWRDKQEMEHSGMVGVQIVDDVK